MHNPYANHNPAASVPSHVMSGAQTGVPDVHKRDKDAIYGWVTEPVIYRAAAPGLIKWKRARPDWGAH